MHYITFATYSHGAFTDLTPYQYGREQCEPGHAFGPARRSHYLFHYVISGKGTLVADSDEGTPTTYRLEGGQGFLLFPGQVATYVADLKNPWQYTWVEFDGLRVKQAVESCGFSLGSPVYTSSSAKLSQAMVDEIAAMLAETNDPEAEYSTVGHLYLFFNALCTSMSAKPAESASSKANELYVQDAIKFIEANYRGEVSVEQLAERAGLNRSYFGKVFKKTTGKSPQQYLLLYRMAKAADLLKLTALSVGDISTSVGYANQLHFSRAFKSTYGLSPREWRKETLVVTKHELPLS